MIPTTLSSKGQLTIPKSYRQRMRLTGRRRVYVEQLDDGTVLIRPAKSVLHLAGTLGLKRPLLNPEEEKREMHRQLGREGNERNPGK
jgi:AbrB family looped-hinge helix DNA binding protein